MDDIFRKIDEHTRHYRVSHWQGTFRDYLPLVLAQPKLAGLTLVKKMRLYDGQEVEGFRQKDVKLIKAQTEREGMDGISPRFVINRIASSLIRPNTTCINPIDILRALKDGVETQGTFTREAREK